MATRFETALAIAGPAGNIVKDVLKKRIDYINRLEALLSSRLGNAITASVAGRDNSRNNSIAINSEAKPTDRERARAL